MRVQLIYATIIFKSYRLAEMAYSDFTLDRAIRTFDLTLSDRVDMFSTVPELPASEFLTEILLIEYFLNSINKILGILANGITIG